MFHTQAEAEVQRLIVDLLWADPRGKTGASVGNLYEIYGKFTHLWWFHREIDGKSMKNDQLIMVYIGKQMGHILGQLPMFVQF